MKGKRLNIKRTTSFILLFSILINGFIFNVPVSFGADNRAKVTITNVYTNFNRSQKRITIEDPAIADFQNKVLKVQSEDDEWHTIRDINTVGRTIVQANIDYRLVIKDVIIEGRKLISGTNPPVYEELEARYTGINEAGIPEILNVDKPIVRPNEEIILNGKDNIKSLVDSDKYTITVGGIVAQAEFNEDTNQLILTPANKDQGEQFPRGIRDIIVRREEAKTSYDLETSFVYKNAVRITGELGIDGVVMFPTMGSPGSRVTFRRKNFPADGYDIYFIRDLNNPEFTPQNMGRNLTFNLPANEGEDTIITIEVPPNLSSGPYYVVFTNKDSQQYGIDSTYVLNQQFQVVTVTQRPIIDSVQPNSAPSETPTEVRINGKYFLNHNVPGFEPKEAPRINEVKEGADKVVINYGKGSLTLPDSGGNPTEYNVEVTREIEVYIGNKLKFKEGGFEAVPGTPGDPNTFIVMTGDYTIEETQREDVIIRVTTTITGGFEAQMQQEVVQSNGFTYYPSTEKPNVDRVVPDIIPIEEVEGNFYLDSSMERLLLSIEGDNFLVSRYTTEDGQERINYPKVTIGGTVINPNAEENSGEHKPIKYEVIKDGKLVDGTPGNEIGNRILIELKAGPHGFKVTNKESRIVSIRNPKRQSWEYSNTDWDFSDLVRFEQIDKNDFPVINSVRPSLVSIDGGEDVIVTGSNFRPGAKVYIENRLVPNINISGDGKTITFKAPPGSRPGETILQVINPEGGIATHVFTYTETYTEPKLAYINPKEGTTNTLVTVKGENFLAPDPTLVIKDINQVDEHLIYRLIGTRIFIDGHDINEYNRGEQNRIKLEPFANGKIFKYNTPENRVELGEYYDSVVLFDKEAKKFYTIVRDVRNNYFIEGGEGISYRISYENGQFKADNHIITQRDGEISFNGMTLKAYTPFKIQNGKIVGNRVRFVDSNTLTFTVPNLNNSPWTGEGLYDVSIVNPDTKSQTIPDGFYFYASPSTRPKVVDIIPDRGPNTGGNVIQIIGPDPDGDTRVGFMDIGREKTKVFIGGQQVPEEDITILPGGRRMEVKVPPTIENIKDKGTDRITVPIVLVNPDGGTFSISYQNPLRVERQSGDEKVEKIIRGYTYVVPTSNPKITAIYPKEGSAAGGYILEIFGSDFRDFEPFVDTVGDGVYEEGMPFDDIDGDGKYTGKAPVDKKAPSKYNPDYEYLTSPIFPKVYFGNKEAELVQFGNGYLQVIVPSNEPGTVDLFVVNNDSGISNKIKFTYTSSKPQIRDVVPNVGDIRGGTQIGLYGSDFENNRITLVRKDSSNENDVKTVHMPLVRFGNNTNEELAREHPNSGVLRSDTARVSLDGGIEVFYDAKIETLTVTIEENELRYTNTYKGYNGEEIFINTKDLKNGDHNYPYEQLIGIKVDTNRLIVSANYAPQAHYHNKTQVSLITPNYHKAGRTPIFIINPDKGIGQGEFEFKYPDSNPSITNITRDGGEGPEEEVREEIGGKAKVLKVDYRGGNIVTIHGTDFREGAIIKIENLLTIGERDIEYNLPNELKFTMPSVPASEANKLLKVVVENRDGGTASSDRNDPPIYIEFIIGDSNPEIYTIEPDRGPATGGTLVRITGMDFRNVMEKYPKGKLKVYFGDALATKIKFIDYKSLEVTAPISSVAGPVQVRVENPDGSITRENISFTYISKPRINTISPNKLFTNDTETEVTITGSMFQPGAKVIVGGRIVDKKDLEAGMDIKGEGIISVDSQGRNREVAVVGGLEAASVTVEGDNVIKVKFQEGKGLDNNSIIIINPDGGISDPYDKFRYEVPVPTKPLLLEAIPGYESTVQLIWSKSEENILNRATRYEIYGKLAKDRNYTFIGDTTGAEFLVKGLEPNTQYEFMVRALNEHGAALDFATAKVKTLSLREDEKLKDKEDKLKEGDKELEEKGKEEVIGGRLVKVLGSQDINKRLVDFTLSKYKNYDKFTVSIPIQYARKDHTLTIKEGTLELVINTRDLYTLEVSRQDRGHKDSHINIHIDRIRETYIPRGKQVASRAYDIYFEYQYGKDKLTINSLLRPGRISLKQDTLTYPNTKNTRLYRFDQPRGQYVSIGKDGVEIKNPGKYILLSDR
ncbi:MAG: hypothetical protein GXY88_05870 [Tissierellia bacterium]|nr:hypothetical protein [Tissierellia bacterium]